MDIQEAKEYEAKRARTMIQEAMSEAMDDKETWIAKAKKSASKCRRLWQKAELTASHAQSKLEVTVNEFEAKTAAVKRRNHNDVKGLLTEMSTLVTNTGNERKRSVGHQAKFRGSHQARKCRELECVLDPKRLVCPPRYALCGKRLNPVTMVSAIMSLIK